MSITVGEFVDVLLSPLPVFIQTLDENDNISWSNLETVFDDYRDADIEEIEVIPPVFNDEGIYITTVDEVRI